ncbi:nucleotidyl transferase AbiEii/AbiGii toxin family protein [uncultured Desulfosarcina sp.]|uniref:nucleotidyl transferase AbiEii/AbiGii toxin family protein n=1 Tax=uncultured Desulfosarcina sp. TaxID=218289 RepID=UPI0029C968E0|nr:nucleotidyl transferase AbiEii/AbiGii toxin family protein [uncultured Desulfosarcina sp.]
MKSNPYTEQVRLLVALLPSVAKQSCFALKGGTAINLFVRDMPRLSVDIDLAYLPVEDRDTSLAAIDQALGVIAADIEHHIPRTVVRASVLKGTGKRFKLLVLQGEIGVKIEVTPVLRGSVFQPEERQLSARAADAFGFTRMAVLSFADLYAGKMCAALDRQHPRDLYDVYWLLRQEGVDEHLKNAFLVYLMGHNRPMAELLAPQIQDIAPQYHAEFSGMASFPVELDQLRETLPELVRVIHAVMSDGDKRFLLALKRGDEDWRDFALPGVERLPAIQWKMLNLARMQPAKRRQAVEKLERILFG